LLYFIVIYNTGWAKKNWTIFECW